MKLKIINSINKKEIVIIAITLVIGLTIGNIVFSSSNSEPIKKVDSSKSSVSQETIWTCSMHPQIRQHEPGDCPICGMELIPVDNHAEKEHADSREIQMSESAIKLADVQTYIVRNEIPKKNLYLLGKVKYDERNIATLTARFGGRIEKLFVNFTGQKVVKGQRLASIYSPDLITAQQELIEALKYKTSNTSFYNAARNKLKLWDLNDTQIDSIELAKRALVNFDILSPITGTVTVRNVSVGNYVKEGFSLFKIVDLSRLWIMFDAYESDLPWIKLGDNITYTVKSLPGKTFKGKISFIDPIINKKTRIAQIRVETTNFNSKLKPEMFVDGVLHATIYGESKKLIIPKTSVLWTGKRSVVYVKIKNRKIPSFIYREIELGANAGDYYVVANGLSAGDEIASNGVFKIDASAQLSGKPSMMNPNGGKVITGHNHGGKKMSDKEMSEMNSSEKSPKQEDQITVPKSFKQQLGIVVTAYLKMKDGFVATNEKMVKNEAKNVLLQLSKVDMKPLNSNAMTLWIALNKDIKANLNGIVQMKGIEMKRSHFSIVSAKIAKAIEAFGLDNKQPIYLEFCPMAFDNKGAYWISAQKKISNPYFGSKMMTCGEVKKQY